MSEDECFSVFMDLYGETNENPIHILPEQYVRMDYELQRRVLSSPTTEINRERHDFLLVPSISSQSGYDNTVEKPIATSPLSQSSVTCWNLSSMKRIEFVQIIDMICNSTKHRNEFVSSGGLTNLVQMLPTLEDSLHSRPSSLEEEKRKELATYALLSLLTTDSKFCDTLLELPDISNRLVQMLLCGNRNQRKNAELSLLHLFGKDKMASVNKYIKPLTLKSKTMTNVLFHGQAVLKLLCGDNNPQKSEISRNNKMNSSIKKQQISTSSSLTPQVAQKASRDRKQLYIDIPSPSNLSPQKGASKDSIPFRKPSITPSSNEDLVKYWHLDIPPKFPRPTPPLTPTAGLTPVRSPSSSAVKRKAILQKANERLQNGSAQSQLNPVNIPTRENQTVTADSCGDYYSFRTPTAITQEETKEETKYDLLLKAADELRVELDNSISTHRSGRVVWTMEELQKIALCVYSIWCLLLREPEIIAADMLQRQNNIQNEQLINEEEHRMLASMPKSLRTSLMSFLKPGGSPMIASQMLPTESNFSQQKQRETKKEQQKSLRPYLLDQVKIIPKLLQLLEMVDDHMSAREAMDDIISVYSSSSSPSSAPLGTSTQKSLVATASSSSLKRNTSFLRRSQSSLSVSSVSPLTKSQPTGSPAAPTPKGILKTSNSMLFSPTNANNSTPRSVRNATFADGTKVGSEVDIEEGQYISQYTQHLVRLRQSLAGCLWCFLSAHAGSLQQNDSNGDNSTQHLPFVSHWIAPYKRSLHQRLTNREKLLAVGEMVVVYDRVAQVLIIRSLDRLYCYDVEGILQVMHARGMRLGQISDVYPLRTMQSREDWVVLCCSVIETQFGISVKPTQGHWVQGQEDIHFDEDNRFDKVFQVQEDSSVGTKTVLGEEEEEEDVHAYEDGEDIAFHKQSYYVHRNREKLKPSMETLQESAIDNEIDEERNEKEQTVEKPSYATKISFDENDDFATPMAKEGILAPTGNERDTVVVNLLHVVTPSDINDSSFIPEQNLVKIEAPSSINSPSINEEIVSKVSVLIDKPMKEKLHLPAIDQEIISVYPKNELWQSLSQSKLLNTSHFVDGVLTLEDVNICDKISGPLETDIKSVDCDDDSSVLSVNSLSSVEYPIFSYDGEEDTDDDKSMALHLAELYPLGQHTKLESELDFMIHSLDDSKYDMDPDSNSESRNDSFFEFSVGEMPNAISEDEVDNTPTEEAGRQAIHTLDCNTTGEPLLRNLSIDNDVQELEREQETISKTISKSNLNQVDIEVTNTLEMEKGELSIVNDGLKSLTSYEPPDDAGTDIAPKPQSSQGIIEKEISTLCFAVDDGQTTGKKDILIVDIPLEPANIIVDADGKSCSPENVFHSRWTQTHLFSTAKVSSLYRDESIESFNTLSPDKVFDSVMDNVPLPKEYEVSDAADTQGGAVDKIITAWKNESSPKNIICTSEDNSEVEQLNLNVQSDGQTLEDGTMKNEGMDMYVQVDVERTMEDIISSIHCSSDGKNENHMTTPDVVDVSTSSIQVDYDEIYPSSTQKKNENKQANGAYQNDCHFLESNDLSFDKEETVHAYSNYRSVPQYDSWETAAANVAAPKLVDAILTSAIANVSILCDKRAQPPTMIPLPVVSSLENLSLRPPVSECWYLNSAVENNDITHGTRQLTDMSFSGKEYDPSNPNILIPFDDLPSVTSLILADASSTGKSDNAIASFPNNDTTDLISIENDAPQNDEQLIIAETISMLVDQIFVSSFQDERETATPNSIESVLLSTGDETREAVEIVQMQDTTLCCTATVNQSSVLDSVVSILDEIIMSSLPHENMVRILDNGDSTLSGPTSENGSNTKEIWSVLNDVIHLIEDACTENRNLIHSLITESNEQTINESENDFYFSTESTIKECVVSVVEEIVISVATASEDAISKTPFLNTSNIDMEHDFFQEEDRKHFERLENIIVSRSTDDITYDSGSDVANITHITNYSTEGNKSSTVLTRCRRASMMPSVHSTWMEVTKELQLQLHRSMEHSLIQENEEDDEKALTAETNLIGYDNVDVSQLIANLLRDMVGEVIGTSLYVSSTANIDASHSSLIESEYRNVAEPFTTCDVVKEITIEQAISFPENSSCDHSVSPHYDKEPNRHSSIIKRSRRASMMPIVHSTWMEVMEELQAHRSMEHSLIQENEEENEKRYTLNLEVPAKENYEHSCVAIDNSLVSQGAHVSFEEIWGHVLHEITERVQFPSSRSSFEQQLHEAVLPTNASGMQVDKNVSEQEEIVNATHFVTTMVCDIINNICDTDKKVAIEEEKLTYCIPDEMHSFRNETDDSEVTKLEEDTVSDMIDLIDDIDERNPSNAISSIQNETSLPTEMFVPCDEVASLDDSKCSRSIVSHKEPNRHSSIIKRSRRASMMPIVHSTWMEVMEELQAHRSMEHSLIEEKEENNDDDENRDDGVINEATTYPLMQSANSVESTTDGISSAEFKSRLEGKDLSLHKIWDYVEQEERSSNHILFEMEDETIDADRGLQLIEDSDNHEEEVNTEHVSVEMVLNELLEAVALQVKNHLSEQPLTYETADIDQKLLILNSHKCIAMDPTDIGKVNDIAVPVSIDDNADTADDKEKPEVDSVSHVSDTITQEINSGCGLSQSALLKTYTDEDISDTIHTILTQIIDRIDPTSSVKLLDDKNGCDNGGSAYNSCETVNDEAVSEVDDIIEFIINAFDAEFTESFVATEEIAVSEVDELITPQEYVEQILNDVMDKIESMHHESSADNKQIHETDPNVPDDPHSNIKKNETVDHMTISEDEVGNSSSFSQVAALDEKETNDVFLESIVKDLLVELLEKVESTISVTNDNCNEDNIDTCLDKEPANDDRKVEEEEAEEEENTLILSSLVLPETVTVNVGDIGDTRKSFRTTDPRRLGLLRGASQIINELDPFLLVTEEDDISHKDPASNGVLANNDNDSESEESVTSYSSSVSASPNMRHMNISKKQSFSSTAYYSSDNKCSFDSVQLKNDDIGKVSPDAKRSQRKTVSFRIDNITTTSPPQSSTSTASSSIAPVSGCDDASSVSRHPGMAPLCVAETHREDIPVSQLSAHGYSLSESLTPLAEQLSDVSLSSFDYVPSLATEVDVLDNVADDKRSDNFSARKKWSQVLLSTVAVKRLTALSPASLLALSQVKDKKAFSHCWEDSSLRMNDDCILDGKNSCMSPPECHLNDSSPADEKLKEETEEEEEDEGKTAMAHLEHNVGGVSHALWKGHPEAHIKGYVSEHDLRTV